MPNSPHAILPGYLSQVILFSTVFKIKNFMPVLSSGVDLLSLLNFPRPIENAYIATVLDLNKKHEYSFKAQKTLCNLGTKVQIIYWTTNNICCHLQVVQGFTCLATT